MMRYFSHLPSTLVKSLRHRTPIITLQDLKEYSGRSLSTTECVSVALCICSNNHVPNNYELFRAVRTALESSLTANHVNLAKWITCKQKVSLSDLHVFALWTENETFMRFLKCEYQFNTIGTIYHIVCEVPTTFTVSYLLSVAYPGTSNAHTLYTSLLTSLALTRHMDLLVPLMDAILKREVCTLCEWGRSKGYVERCVHVQDSFGIRKHGQDSIDDDISEQIKELYPWLRYF